MEARPEVLGRRDSAKATDPGSRGRHRQSCEQLVLEHATERYAAGDFGCRRR